MSVDSKTIDLIIRTAVQGGQTLTSVTKSISDIEKALTAQAAAAKRGEVSIDELKATLLSLQKVQAQLKSQADLIGQFDRLGKQMGVTAEKAAKAAKAQGDYAAKLDAAGKATDFQTGKLQKLTAASERQGGILAKQRTDYEALGSTLREAGIDVGKLADAEDQARQGAAQLGLTIARTNTAISTYAADLRLAREESKKLADDASFAKKIDEAARLNKAGEYVNFWTEALNKADVAEQQLQTNNALRKAADDAVAAARGYKTLGAAINTLGGSSGSLRSVVDGIISPSEKARTTLSGVEDQIKAVSDAAKSAKGPIDNYRELMSDLTGATKSLAEKSSLIDSFSKQVAALRASRTEFAQARTQVLQYAEAVRNSAGQNDALQASLRQAQVRLSAAAKTLGEELTVTRGLRDTLRAAGVSTNDLAGAQARLVTAAKGSVSALNSLSAAKERYGVATNKAAAAQGMFENSGRTTLSWLQRIRGEVLSLVAAYAGIYGAIQGATSSIDAFNSKQAIQNQLALTAGNDNRKIAAEYEYIRQQADRLGLSFESAARGYAKFSAAATLAGRSGDEIKYIFESFAEVGRVAGLSADNMDGVFKALEQVISKGTIQAEELRGQLGDRLFGAFQVAAKALKDQFPQLDKAMKDGKVTSEQLVLIAEEYKKIVGERLPDATKSMVANQERLNSVLFDFKVLVAEKGFADEYAKLITTLATYLKSTDGERFAQNLADAFGNVARALRWIVDNAELVKQTLYVAFALVGARAVATLAIALVGLTGKLRLLGAEAIIASTAIGTIGNAFRVLTAALVGWEIGTILSQKFGVVRQFGVSLVFVFETAWTTIKYGAQIIWAEIPALFVDGLAKLANLLTSGVRGILGIFSAAAKAVGKDDLGKSIDLAISSIEFKVDRIGNASAKLRKQMTADLKQIRKLSKEMFDDVGKDPTSTPVVGSQVSATPKPTLVKPGTTAVDSAAAAKRISLREQLENELTAIEARIEKNETDSLSRRLAAIDLSYLKLVKKLRAFGGAEGATMEARLTRDVNELKLQETRKFNDVLEKEHEAIQRKLESIDAAAGRKAKTDLQARLDAVRDQYQQVYRDIAAEKEKLTLNGRDTSASDEVKRRLDSGVLALQNLETQKYYEDTINSLLAERTAKINTLNELRKAGLITDYEANIQATEAIEAMQPKIQATADEALRYAEAMISAAVATGENVTALEAMRAKMIEASASGKGMTAEAQLTGKIMSVFTSTATTGLMSMSEQIAKSAFGFQSWKEGIKGVRDSFLNFAADFLKQIAQMIIKQVILNALQSSSKDGGWVGAIAGAIVGKNHTGGVIGATGGMTTMADPAWFSNAPRYHGGGIAGLAPDEYPSILKKNEEVLTTSDPRNVLNGGKSSGTQAKPQDVSISNYVDAQSFLSAAAATPAGRKVIMNVLSAERSTLKTLVGA